MRVTLPDGSTKEFDQPVTAAQVAADQAAVRDAQTCQRPVASVFLSAAIIWSLYLLIGPWIRRRLKAQPA